MCFRFGCCFGGGGDDFGTPNHRSSAPKTPRGGSRKAGADHRKGHSAYSDDEAWRKNLHDVHRPREDQDNGHTAYACHDKQAYPHAPAAVAAAEAPRLAARNINKVGHDHHAAGYRTDHESAMAMVYHYPAAITNTLARY